MSMAPLTAVLDAPTTPDTGVVTNDDFELYMRVVEAATKPEVFMCNTNDGCGSTCSTSACSTSSYDPR
jgi:FxLD family lantipeptide